MATRHSDPGLPDRQRGDRQALLRSGILTAAYFVVEFIIGLRSGSVAVLSDAFHTFSAVGGVLIALVAQRLSARPASLEHTYGWGRAEIIGALFNGLLLVFMAVAVMWTGAQRLRNPIDVETDLMIFAASGGLITEIIAFRMLYSRQKKDLNIKGAFWHVLQTFFGSLIIIASALVIHFTGFLAIDPLLGMAFGLLLFWAAWRILRAALRILLQSTPKGFRIGPVIDMLRSLKGVRDVHHIHVWSLTEDYTMFSGHVRVESLARDGERVLIEASERLTTQFNVYLSTLQIEEECVAGEEVAKSMDIPRRSAD